MAKATVEQIARDIATLEPDERARLRALLDAATDREARHAALRQAFRDLGLIVREPQPVSGPEPEYRRINVPGKPISEAIIEERR